MTFSCRPRVSVVLARLTPAALHLLHPVLDEGFEGDVVQHQDGPDDCPVHLLQDDMDSVILELVLDIFCLNFVPQTQPVSINSPVYPAAPVTQEFRMSPLQLPVEEFDLVRGHPDPEGDVLDGVEVVEMEFDYDLAVGVLAPVSRVGMMVTQMHVLGER